MKRINDIFYSLQGEGYHTGRAAVFVRFAGCNLCCPFCDTDFDDYREMSDADIVAAVNQACRQTAGQGMTPAMGRMLVILTGGEPTLQAGEDFVELLHQGGYEVAMESNGTRPAPRNLDWLTVSPKENWKVDNGGKAPDELKLVFDEDTVPESFLQSASAFSRLPRLYLQPCDTGNANRNSRIIDSCVEYIKKHPWWRLSLQTQKLAGFK